MNDCEIDPSLEGVEERLEELYSAPFARHMGIEPVYISADEVRMRMDLRPEHRNSLGVCHGSVIYALADHTLAFASNIFRDAIGQSANIIYHRPAVGDSLESVSRRINESRSFGVYDIRVYSQGKLAASGTFTAYAINRS